MRLTIRDQMIEFDPDGLFIFENRNLGLIQVMVRDQLSGKDVTLEYLREHEMNRAYEIAEEIQNGTYNQPVAPDITEGKIEQIEKLIKRIIDSKIKELQNDLFNLKELYARLADIKK